jgi:ribonuclease VapC
MIVDSSALVAILKGELEAGTLFGKLESSIGRSVLSAASYFETSIIIDRDKAPEKRARLDQLIDDTEIEIAPVTANQARIARQAYQEFGKGNGHPARLNFGDCFAFALATERNDALLFKGDDFSHTGIRRA